MAPTPTAFTTPILTTRRCYENRRQRYETRTPGLRKWARSPGGGLPEAGDARDGHELPLVSIF